MLRRDDEHREYLLERAAQLVARRGFGALGLRELAQGLGLTTGGLYHYVESKEALLAALVERAGQAQRQRLGSVSLSQEPLETWWRVAAGSAALLVEEWLIQQEGLRHLPDPAPVARDARQEPQALARALGWASPGPAEALLATTRGLLFQRHLEGRPVTADELRALGAHLRLPPATRRAGPGGTKAGPNNC